MIRCPKCGKACNERDEYCRHCGERLKKGAQPFWRLGDWVDGRHAVRALAAASALLGLRVLVHPLIMPYQGSRHELRVLAFHLLLGAGIGLCVAPLRLDRRRWWIYLGLGIFGAAFSWAMDYAFMVNHQVVKWVFYLLEWLAPQSDTIGTNFGILQTLRFLGPVLVFSLALTWMARPSVVLRILLFSLLALAFRFPVKGYALDHTLILDLPKHASLYFASLLAFFYGLGAVDSNSAK